MTLNSLLTLRWYVSLFLLAGVFGTPALAQQFQWVSQFRITQTNNGNYGLDIAKDDTSNTYSLLETYSAFVDVDPGPGVVNVMDGLHIVKLDSMGNFRWTRRISSNDSYGAKTRIAADRVGNTFLNDGPAKRNPAGDIVWSYNIDFSTDIAVDNRGFVYITGFTNGGTDFDPGPGVSILSRGYYVCKYNTDGQYVWGRTVSSSSSIARVVSLDVDKNGNVVIAGAFMQTVVFGSGPDAFQLTSAGDEDAFICSINPNGTVRGAYRLGGPLLDRAHVITVDDNGNILTSGMFSGTADFNPGPGVDTLVGPPDIYGNVQYRNFISKLDSLGNYVWAKGYSVTPEGYSVPLYTFAMDTDGAGNIFASITPPSDGDVLAMVLNPAGNPRWSMPLSRGISNRQGSLVATTSGMAYFIGAPIAGNLDFDPGPGEEFRPENNGVFVLKINGNPPPPPIRSVQNGLWSNSATWSCACVPPATAYVSIEHVVTVPAGTTQRARRVGYASGGRLSFENGANLLLSANP